MSVMDPDVEFFGVEIPPNTDISVQEHLEADETSYSSIHATQVALGDKPAPGRHTVFVTTREGRFAIGTLEKGRVEHFQVDYMADANLTFSHTGASTVFITGYKSTTSLAMMESDGDEEEGRALTRGEVDDEEDDEDEDEDEEAPLGVPMNGAATAKQKANMARARKLAAAQQQALVDEEDDEDDDEDDEDDDEDEEEEGKLPGIKTHTFDGMEEDDDDEDDEDDDEDDDDEDDAGAEARANAEFKAVMAAARREQDEDDDDEDEDDDDDEEDDEEEDEPAPPVQVGAKRAKAAAPAAAQPAKKAKAAPGATPAKPAAATPAKTPKGAAAGGAGGDVAAFEKALKEALRTKGPTTLAALGSAVKRPASVPKLKKFLEEHKAFNLDPKTQIASLA